MSESEHLPSLQLYSGLPQHDAFSRMRELFPAREMPASTVARPFAEGEELTLPSAFALDGGSTRTDGFLEQTDTAALLVVQDGALRFERYWLTGGRSVPWISWSTAKSFVSALVGIAAKKGMIESVDDPIDRYVEWLGSTGYAGVPIVDVLEMSSGVRWNEDYSDPKSDISRFGAAISAGGSLDEFLLGSERAVPPGTFCQYNSTDTQALGALLVTVTGEPLAQSMERWLAEPLGFEYPSYWLLDARGMEMAFGGMLMTARDFAKLGQLYLDGGACSGRQVVPASWVDRSLISGKGHLQADRVEVGGHVFGVGYGWQWWLPEGSRSEFSAIGVYNQFVYVDPPTRTVVVKLSANRAYGTTPGEESNRELETIEFLRAICRQTEEGAT